MSQTNLEFSNLLKLFSRFYTTIIQNENDIDLLKSNLTQFQDSFINTENKFHHTKEFLKNLNEKGKAKSAQDLNNNEIKYSQNYFNEEKNIKFDILKNDISKFNENEKQKEIDFNKNNNNERKILRNYDKFTKEDFLNEHRNVLDILIKQEKKIKTFEIIPDLKTKANYLIESLAFFNKNSNFLLSKFDLVKQSEEPEKKLEPTKHIDIESNNSSNFNSEKRQNKKFIQRCYKCNKEYVENEIKDYHEYLCFLCR